MNKWLKMIRVKAILPAAALLAAAAIGTTFAWQTWDLSVENQLKAHDVSVEVQEDFDGNEQKKVAFKNTGSSSVFLRVSYGEFWEGMIDVNGEDKKTVLSNDVNGVPVATKNWTSVWPDNNASSPGNYEWKKGSDGWYYYNRVLKQGETTHLILDSVTFPSELGKDGTAYELYNKNNYHLYFKAEVVQCSDGSNTLNSPEVNAAATGSVFGQTGKVEEDGVTVTWTLD